MNIPEILRQWADAIGTEIEELEAGRDADGRFEPGDDADSALIALTEQHRGPINESLTRAREWRQHWWERQQDYKRCYCGSQNTIDTSDSTYFCLDCKSRMILAPARRDELRENRECYLAALRPLQRRIETVAGLVATTAGSATTESHVETSQDARHSEDFASVYWFGTEFTFGTPAQRAVVRMLWQAMENRTPNCSKDSLLEVSGSTQNRLDMVFRNHPAWKTLIIDSGKDTYRLSRPNR